MTGRDLIIYILENNLDSEPVFKDGVFLGLIGEDEAASRLNVGVATVRAWFEMGILLGVKMSNKIYIFPNSISGMLKK